MTNTQIAGLARQSLRLLAVEGRSYDDAQPSYTADQARFGWTSSYDAECAYYRAWWTEALAMQSPRMAAIVDAEPATASELAARAALAS